MTLIKSGELAIPIHECKTRHDLWLSIVERLVQVDDVLIKFIECTTHTTRWEAWK
jgi:hypothetical protein